MRTTTIWKPGCHVSSSTRLADDDQSPHAVGIIRGGLADARKAFDAPDRLRAMAVADDVDVEHRSGRMHADLDCLTARVAETVGVAPDLVSVGVLCEPLDQSAWNGPGIVGGGGFLDHQSSVRILASPFCARATG